ncbi:S8 family peptidase [Qipengyuania sp. NPDC077410]|uniref:S8 family peptidase n=1 Tax=Qipengyuania sp. NPDC077410 TaxID=3364496 RepID=UPI0037C8A3E2
MITPSDQQPQRSVQDDAEYRRNYTAAEYINALYALDNGWTGKGVLVGVIDDGIHEIPELEGQVDRALSRDFGGTVVNGQLQPREGGSNSGDINSTHGTPVAAIIGARNNGVGIQGLAPDVTLVSLRVDATVNGNHITGFRSNEAIEYAMANDIKLLNMSLSRLDPTTVSTIMQDVLTEYREFGGLLVNSAGNNVQGNPGNYLDVTEANAEALLFVVAVSPSPTEYTIAGYSNHCGQAMDRCVAAVGSNVTHDVNGEAIAFGGTSSAAPQVTALAAMILSKWPQLSGVDAGNVILNTARDIGDAGVDEIYGHGLIDVKAALSPVDPMLSNGKTSSSIDNSVMVVGGAFGGGYGPSSIESIYSDVTVLDAYGRDYDGDISGLVIRPGKANANWLQRRMQAQTNAGSTGFVSPKASASIGYTAFETQFRDSSGDPILQNHLSNAAFAFRMNEDTTVTAGYNSGDNVMDDIMGLAPSSDAMFAYSPLAQTSMGVSHKLGEGRLAVSAFVGRQEDTATNGLTVQWQQGPSSLKLGLVNETGTVFGTPVGAGAMRFGDGSNTLFVEAASGFDLGRWQFDGYASLGATRLKLADDMLLTDVDTITSGRFGFTASREALGGLVSFGVAQRLVALSGNATFTVGNGYDLGIRGLTFADRTVDLRGRMTPQLTFGFEKTAERSALRFGIAGDVQGRDLRAVGTWHLTLN